MLPHRACSFSGCAKFAVIWKIEKTPDEPEEGTPTPAKNSPRTPASRPPTGVVKNDDEEERVETAPEGSGLRKPAEDVPAATPPELALEPEAARRD
jgi:hypothetical protein